MDIQEILQVEQVTQITQEHINIMNNMLNNNQRAEVYLYYSKLIGDQNPSAVNQLMFQSQITTYSGVAGGAALAGNFNAKINNQDKYNITLDDFSKEIIIGMINTIDAKINDTQNPSTGILSADEIQQADQNVWADKQMPDYFPGNFQLSLDPTQNTEKAATNVLFDAWIGGYAALEGAALGKRIDEFSDSEYTTITDNGFIFKINNSSGMIEGVFPTSDASGTNYVSYLANEKYFNGTPTDSLEFFREEKWNFMSANGQGGSSIYDGIIGLDSSSQEFKDFVNINDYPLYDETINNVVDFVEDKFGKVGLDFLSGNFGDALNGLAQQFKDKVTETLDNFTSSIKNSLTSAYERFKAAISLSLTDPLIIDMGDDGLHLKSWEQSGVMFDLNANGTIEQSGWTTANGNDVFLAIDKNANGNIDNISELFGNATTPGFKELKNFDSNNDNVIDTIDSQFGLLKIWNDSNANGVVNAGEMTTLAENNITSISLKYILTQPVANDNEVVQLKLVA